MLTLAFLVLTLGWYGKQKHHLCQLNVIYFRYFKYNFILGNFKLISKCLIIDKKWSHVLYESLLKASFEVKSCFLDELFIRVLSTTRQKSLEIDGWMYFVVPRSQGQTETYLDRPHHLKHSKREATLLWLMIDRTLTHISS